MADDVYEHVGPNPPGLDILSKYRVVVWKHPQHGALRASAGGGFTPISEAEYQRLRGGVPAAPVAEAPTTTVGGRGAGSTRPNVGGRPTTAYEVAELKRAKKEGEVQAALDKAQFTPKERADPMEGLGPGERAAVAKIVRDEGISVEEAVKRVRKPAAEVQAEGLKP